METVLVCDDDIAILESIEIYLKAEGFNVLKAESGEQALNIIAQNEIQCLVLEKFKANGVHFYHGDYINFNKDGYWRGSDHTQANEFDMRLVIPQKGKSQNVKDILVEAYAEGIIDVVHDVEKALKLVMPHLESGKLTLEMLNRVIRRAYEN